ncbi:MAG: hypothetical protein V3W34_01720 [Phycisphaerae bacterium]
MTRATITTLLAAILTLAFAPSANAQTDCTALGMVDGMPCDPDGTGFLCGATCQSGVCDESVDAADGTPCDPNGLLVLGAFVCGGTCSSGSCDGTAPAAVGTPCNQLGTGDICGGTCQNFGLMACDQNGIIGPDDVPDGTACDAGACIEGETCQGGVCTGTATDCSGAGDQCNDASCDTAGAEGNCNTLTPVANDTPCNVGACIESETCQAGACTGTATDCSGAGDQCNDASCDAAGAEGNCDTLTPVANGTPCNDGFACTEGDVCTGGACAGTPNSSVCTDGLQCTSDSCDPGDPSANPTTGCVFTAVSNGTPCDAGACIEGETCQAGACTGTPTDCSGAGDQCNDASCDAAGAEGNCDTLTPVANDTACDDSDSCNVGEACQGGACSGGAPPDCSGAGDQCNDASCDAAGSEGNCDTLTPVANDTPCDVGACTEGETCQAGVCGGGTGTDCSGAGDQCNDASCDAAGAEGNCDTLTPVADDTPCDGGACIEGDTCQAGACTGTAPDCSGAGDQCNDASCDAAGAEGNCDTLTPVANGTPCDDGDSCNVGEACQGGACSGGDPPDCSGASDQCNDASCDAAGAEGNCDTLTPLADGTACDEDGDSDFCDDTCQLGVCTADTPVDCDDANDCTEDTCDTVDGSCSNTALANDTGCDDGNACSTGETCQIGSCTGGDSLSCDDGVFCNGAETCNAESGCQAGTSPICDDGLACTVDTCDVGSDACVNTSDDTRCDDGVFCNGVETCDPTDAEADVDGCLAGINPCFPRPCDEITRACVRGGGGDGGGTAGPPSGSASASANGTLSQTLSTPGGGVVAQLDIAGAQEGETFTFSVEVDGLGPDNAPGIGQGTFAGFAGGIGLGRTFTAEGTSAPGTFAATVRLVFTPGELADAGVQPEDVQMHTLDTLQTPPVWVPAGENIGEFQPTGLVGEAGFFRDADAITFWSVLDDLSVFAVGAAEVVVTPAGDLDDDGVLDDVDLCPDTPADTEVDADGCAIVVADADGDGVPNNVDDCPGTPVGTEVDDAGCEVIDEPSPEQPTPCGAIPCGLFGMISLWMMMLGLVEMKVGVRRLCAGRRPRT